MKNDISKASFDELSHFVGVFHQMGRLPLDADLNEQNELVLRMLQRVAGDALHTGSPNDGFHVDTHVLLDKLDSRRAWVATPATAALFVDYFDHRVGDGSLIAAGAGAICRTLASPLDLRELREVQIAVKAVSSAGLAFYVKDAATTVTLAMNEVGVDDGWLIVRGKPGAWPAGFAADRIVEYGFTGLNPLLRYAFDVLKADLPLRKVLVRTDGLERYAALPAAAALTPDDDRRLWGMGAIRATQASAVACALPEPCDAVRARALLVSVQRAPAAAPFALMLRDDASPADAIVLAGAVVTTIGAWEVHAFALPQAGVFNWSGLTQLAYAALDTTATYWFGPVLLEADPAADLVVMGGDGTSAGAGRFIGDGRAATKEAHGTYFTQPDLPLADPAALAPVAEAHRRIDWAYLDLWERPLSYVERPALREIALEGPDTCTRTQLVAQVRLLKGVEVPLASDAQPPSDAFAALPRIGAGVLSTKDKPAAILGACADPCEPAIAGPYVGEDNRLFRVEIHRAGDVGLAADAATAWFKWSRDNAGVMCALVADALAGDLSALVEKPELFAVGDLVELADDVIELNSGPYEDRVNHAKPLRGELRKIVTVNLQTRRVSWEDPTVIDPLEIPFHAALPRALRIVHHAKLTRWDGQAACTAGDVVLADGVVIEFGGKAMCAGDYWLFTTRTVDRSVERLIEAPARGVKHDYYPLAAIHRWRDIAPAPEIVFAEDLRPRFAALPDLDASRVAYDPGASGVASDIAGWDEVTTVQQAIDALCEADLTGDMRLHNQLLHGMGVICGLKLRCAKDRTTIVLGKGYALDCDGNLMHQAGDSAIAIVQMAIDQGLLTAAGDGLVNLWVEDSASGLAVHIEPNVPQTFWESVLEGSLLKDFWDDYVLTLVNFLKAQLSPFPCPTLPLSDQHKRVIALLNLVWQVVNSANGPYIFVSKAEHDLLEQFHADLEALLASKTYCALFDSVTTFPAYPYALPTGIDTMFGMWLLHRRVKVAPTGTWAVTYGTGPRVQFFDVASRNAVAVADFPGMATNLDIQDVAFNAAATEMYVVGVVSNGSGFDSVFATATIAPPVLPAIAPTIAWGPSTVVCDIRFVTLVTHALQPSVMFAIGCSVFDPAKRGLYRFNPAAVPLAPSPTLNFNATGLFAIDADGHTAVATEHTGGVQGGDYNMLRTIDLGTWATTTPFNVFGNAVTDDLALNAGMAYLTGESAGFGVLNRMTLAPPAVLAPTILGNYTIRRLGLLPSRNVLTIAEAFSYRLRLFATSTGVLSTTVRIPLQIMPISLAVHGGDTELYALNLLSNTVNAVDVAALIAAAPSFTNEPPLTLAAYRKQMLQSFTDLGGVLLQYLKDGWCDEFLVECPECTKDDKVYLGTIDIRGKQVFKICNFGKRHYAKSFRTWGYWLSAIPILTVVKKLFAKFCCMTLVP
jgi:hypothetical protein